MKKTLLILCFSALFTSCKSNLTIISSVKQTVLPGRPSLPSYTNYKITFEVINNASISVNEVKVNDGEKCYSFNFLLKPVNGSSYVKKISEKGTYLLEIPIKEKTIISKSDCNDNHEKIVVFYQENGKSKKLRISEFLKETKTMR